jgi:hypothetical protein
MKESPIDEPVEEPDSVGRKLIKCCMTTSRRERKGSISGILSKGR